MCIDRVLLYKIYSREQYTMKKNAEKNSKLKI